MRSSLALVSLFLVVAVGCVPKSQVERDREQPVRREKRVVQSSEAVTEEVSRVKEGVVWVEEGIAHDGVVIDLGYRNDLADEPQWLEPVVRITRDGAPVANAMVFNRLATEGGSQAIGEEVATVYGPLPNVDGTFYGRGKLRLPDDASQCEVGFRIVLPSSQRPWTRAVSIQLK